MFSITFSFFKFHISEWCHFYLLIIADTNDIDVDIGLIILRN